jgi:hypothetical protein
MKSFMYFTYMICTPHHIFSGDQITDEMGKASDTYGGEEQCTLSCGVETRMTLAETGWLYDDGSST